MPFGPPVIARRISSFDDYRQRRIGFGRGLPRRARRPAACCGQQRKPRHVEIASDDAEARFQEIERHRQPHAAEPDEGDRSHDTLQPSRGAQSSGLLGGDRSRLGRDLKPGVNLARDDVRLFDEGEVPCPSDDRKARSGYEILPSRDAPRRYKAGRLLRRE